MPPDFLLRCMACGSEAVWDTEAIPPVGVPAVGHPVLGHCSVCNTECRHVIEDCFVITDKLHHEICLATELDRPTVERVMAELYRYRQEQADLPAPARPDPAQEVEEVAESLGLPEELVEAISAAETAWLTQRGYLTDPLHRPG